MTSIYLNRNDAAPILERDTEMTRSTNRKLTGVKFTATFFGALAIAISVGPLAQATPQQINDTCIKAATAASSAGGTKVTADEARICAAQTNAGTSKPATVRISGI
jgi:hypothetical protein